MVYPTTQKTDPAAVPARLFVGLLLVVGLMFAAPVMIGHGPSTSYVAVR
jgi:asparagine N-glycosylation enzyme membrane subunit Stt3